MPLGDPNVVHGEKSGSDNVDPIRLNADSAQLVESYQPLIPFSPTVAQQDPLLVPSVEGILLDGSGVLTPNQLWQVTFEVVNVDGVLPVTVDVGLDVGASGALAGAEFFVKNLVVPGGGGSTGPRVIPMKSADDIRGVASVVALAAIYFIEIKRIT